MQRTVPFLLFLCSCTTADYELSPPPQPLDARPVAVANTDYIDFGAAGTSNQRAWPVVVANAGDATLFIEGVELLGSPAFELEGHLPEQLAPWTSAELAVVYSPVEAEDLGWLEIHTDDPDARLLSVEMVGQRLDPLARLSPEPLSIPCGDTEGWIELRNAGDVRLDIEAIETTEGFYLTQQVSSAVEPGKSIDLSIGVDAGPDLLLGELRVHSNALDSPTLARLERLPAAEAEVVDEWLQSEDRADILVYADQSGSMSGDIANLAANFADFTSALSGVVADWQIAIVTRSNGCHTGAYLNPSTPDLGAAAHDYLFAGVSVGAYTEAGLHVLRNAVERSGPTQCNAGLLRPNTPRLGILLSDESEQSPTDWQSQVDAIRAVADPIRLLSVVGTTYDYSCAGYGWGYIEASNATGGAVLDICDWDWGQKLADHVGLVDGYRDRFELSDEPVGTLSVTVDGNEVSDWTWDSVSNEVRFPSDAVPPPGSVVAIRYPVRVCE